MPSSGSRRLARSEQEPEVARPASVFSVLQISHCFYDLISVCNTLGMCQVSNASGKRVSDC